MKNEAIGRPKRDRVWQSFAGRRDLFLVAGGVAVLCLIAILVTSGAP